MSERRYSINEIADIYQTDRDRVSQWLDWWEQYEFEGLDDDPRSGVLRRSTRKRKRSH
ncbi:MAG: helix-turn-helix domain-containing protein [Blastocatellales bacterium]|nr:helix-turn-helix domain-containing protein [Blastocatellales bacterium]